MLILVYKKPIYKLIIEMLYYKKIITYLFFILFNLLSPLDSDCEFYFAFNNNNTSNIQIL